MTKADNAPDNQTQAADTGSEAALDPSVSRTRTGADDAVSQAARKEALRNASRGDQFVVATDLEDKDQREAAPGTREQD